MLRDVSRLGHVSMRARLTVARPWDLGIRLANADVCGGIATAGPGVNRCHFVAV